MGDTAGSGNPDRESPPPPLKVLAVNLYYAPDTASSGQILAELCEGLVERGLEVTVVAGQPSHNEAAPVAPPAEELNGV